jgi:hypothetical protein
MAMSCGFMLTSTGQGNSTVKIGNPEDGPENLEE